MTTKQTNSGGATEQMACMPVDRSYDVRAKMIIAFNEAKNNGGDLDDALDAAYKSALRYSPNPQSADQGVPVAVASRDESIAWLKRIDGIGQARAELIYSMGFRRLADESNPDRSTYLPLKTTD
ncbi:hypothetical protein [Pseudomonas sp. P7548]|uniref:hypothetical protein n=1 Tax=Pseudomonas sp. P7548 TaxID=2726981 RepID=UPI0015BEFD7F|nr:hypothetical protein [Pseudomonas sp. P7548]NWE18068.1 hypothetical protein [Pseudomonas sp. P7548]